MAHSAISTAPVSEPGTMPSRQPSGMPSILVEREITSASLALGPFARWLRPKAAPSSAAKENPGRLAQGPDEKFGFCGRATGFAVTEKSAIKRLPYRRKAPHWGGVTQPAL